jgi:hypothetical protein
MRRLVIVALSALMSVNAFALFSETEPNDTRATADMVLSGNVAPWSDVGVLSLTRQRQRLLQDSPERGRLANRDYFSDTIELLSRLTP